MATLTVPTDVPSPAEDCEQLHKAFAGWGTNEKLIISILAHRTAEQRQQILKTYSETHGHDLLKDLQKELSSDFEKAVLLWTLPPAERDVLLANEAARKGNSADIVLVEISCARSSSELFFVRKAYCARFKKSLEEDVAVHTSGDFRKLLLPLITAYRHEGPEVNMSVAKSEAKLLHEKISKKEYADDELIRILTTRSKAQIAATLNHYHNEFCHPIFEDLDSKDEFLSALRATLKCLIAPEKYFEELLRDAINKRGTDEGDLTRVVVTRAEVDLKLIQEEYYKRNSVPLAQAIAKDTHGDYERFLLELLGHESP